MDSINNRSDTPSNSYPTPSAEEVILLRDLTGCGLMECKKALLYTECDMRKAQTLLRDYASGVRMQPDPWSEARHAWEAKCSASSSGQLAEFSTN